MQKWERFFPNPDYMNIPSFSRSVSRGSAVGWFLVLLLVCGAGAGYYLYQDNLAKRKAAQELTAERKLKEKKAREAAEKQRIKREREIREKKEKERLAARKAYEEAQEEKARQAAEAARKLQEQAEREEREKGEGRIWNGANVRKRPAGRRKIFLWRKSLNRKGVFPNP